MDKIRHALVIVAWMAFVLLVTGVLYLQQNSNDNARCNDIRTGRIQGNERAAVLRKFLSIAATARAKSAIEATTPAERSLNRDASREYLLLRSRVKDVPLTQC